MRANEKLFWVIAGALLVVSCLFKSWQADRNVLAYVNDIALTRASLDPAVAAEHGPRILIAGGSNALSGYDSSQISAATGIPTFNLSLLSEGYDYRNVFEVVETRARAHDIVLLSTLRLVATRGMSSAGEVEPKIIGNDRWLIPRQARSVSLSETVYLPAVAPLFAEQTLIRMLLMWAEQLRIGLVNADAPSPGESRQPAATAASIHSGFARFAFDERGDWINCTKSDNPKPVPFDPALLAQSEDYLAALDQFAARLQTRGVVLRVTPATVLVQPDAVDQWSEQHRALARTVQTAVFMPFDASRQLLTDRSKFCDTHAHLLRSQIATNNQAVVDTVKSLTEDQVIIEAMKTSTLRKAI